MTTRTADAERAWVLLRNPALWAGSGTDDLLGNLFFYSLILGHDYSESLLEEIRPYYWYVAERTTVEERLGVLTRLSEVAEKRVTGPVCLLPFLCADEEPAVISSAALLLCVLILPKDGDLLTGPKAVLKYTEASDTEPSRAGILQGILLLGDRRVLPLLERCWESLGAKGRHLLAHAWSGFVYASTVEFLLDWLEKTEDECEYGVISGVLAGYPLRRDKYPFVVDVERKFPANGPGNDPVVRRIAQWTFEEYGKIIAPRLKAIGEAETGDKVIPKVLGIWGIS